MTLVHNNHIKELWLKEFFVLLLAALTYKLLIKRKVNLVSCVSWSFIFLITYLVNGLVQRFEVLLYRLVYKHISICQVKNFLYQTSFEKSIDYLESCVRFARTRCHYKQETLLTLRYRVDRSIYGIALIVTWRKYVLTRTERLVDNLHLVVRQAGTAVAFRDETCI